MTPTSPSPELIAELRCPETRQSLSLANAELLARIVADSGRESLEGALIRADGLRAYPIEDGFPVLLIDDAIDITGDR